MVVNASGAHCLGEGWWTLPNASIASAICQGCPGRPGREASEARAPGGDLHHAEEGRHAKQFAGSKRVGEGIAWLGADQIRDIT